MFPAGGADNTEPTPRVSVLEDGKRTPAKIEAYFKVIVGQDANTWYRGDGNRAGVLLDGDVRILAVDVR